MIIVPGRPGGEPSERRGATFTGPVWADPLLPATDGVTVNSVLFTPGSRTYWHQHEGGQLLHVHAGGGLIAAAGEAPRRLRPGDLVWAPPGERHWHGAGPDTFMHHLAVSIGTTAWAEEVAEDDYLAAPDGEGHAA